ncbi:hypothetical protein F5Y06DRAFT_261804 [Hypoxylon sp. FL0890]|nr:hypothetical protein F5Y06DRAFT_261804 [Hypoxylon sp. FL0890]
MEGPSSSAPADPASQASDPLSSAVANGDEDLLRTLLGEGNTRDEVRSPPGITLLHIAIGNGHINIARILLENGAALEGYGPDGKTNLQVAVESGFHNITELLLEFRAKFGLSSEEDGPSLLLRAIERDDFETTEVLLKWGANLNVRNEATYTPLMVAVSRGNVSIAKLLLEHGADCAARSDDGLSAKDLACGSEELKSLLDNATFLQGPYLPSPMGETSTTGRVTLELPRAPIHNADKMVACHGFQISIIDFFIEESERRIETSASVYEVLYGKGPAALMKEATPPSASGKSPSFRWYHLPANNLEWVEVLLKRHLSETGRMSSGLSEEEKSQLEICRLQGVHHSGTVYSTAKRPGCHAVKKKLCDYTNDDIYQLASFVPFLHFETNQALLFMSDAIINSFSTPFIGSGSGSGASSDRESRGSKVRGPPPLPDMVQNRYSPSINQRGSIDAHQSQPAKPPLVLKNLHEHLICGYLRPEPPDHGSSLQMRRTLDQYFYTHLHTAHPRNRDQVVSRCTGTHEAPKLFMIDQLWLWVINGDTVISCIPMQWESWSEQNRPRRSDGILGWLSTRPRNRGKKPAGVRDVLDQDQEKSECRPKIPALIENNPLDVYRAILKHLHSTQRTPIMSACALAGLITEACVNVFDPHSVPSDFQFFDFFEVSLGIVADRAAQQLEYFRTSIAWGIAPGGDEPQLDLVAETEILVEVEDIRDELNILKTVLEDQKVVLEDLTKAFRLVSGKPTDSSDVKLPSQEQNRILENHLYRIRKMETIADRTSKMLITLLDLKQKQASISEAFSARKQAENSVHYAQMQAEQAQETAKQGRTLMLFTVVTILFLPLSFMAAFFAINIDAFPKDDAGSLELGYVLKYMLSISAGLSIPFILITFNQQRVWSLIGTFSSFVANIPIGLWAMVALAAILQVVTWTSKLSYSAKIAMAITISILTAMLFCYYLWHLHFVYRRHDRRRKEPNHLESLWRIVKKRGKLRPAPPASEPLREDSC